ncbi:hypothetical protein M885DRAFT_604682 [Pelagophyceae sp. CCMP2097]|nr:hypothetical protein M885DRAFT_604682 [Pelagophyceae sp. CCMP2097]
MASVRRMPGSRSARGGDSHDMTPPEDHNYSKINKSQMSRVEEVPRRSCRLDQPAARISSCGREVAHILVALNSSLKRGVTTEPEKPDDLHGRTVSIVVKEGDIQRGRVTGGPNPEGKMCIAWTLDGSSSWHSREFVLRTSVHAHGSSTRRSDADVLAQAPGLFAGARVASKRHLSPVARVGQRDDDDDDDETYDGLKRLRPSPPPAAFNKFSVLEQWCLDHIESPYPSQAEKKRLEDICQMTERQIKDWFSNVRKRKIIPVVRNRRPPRGRFELQVAQIFNSSRCEFRDQSRCEFQD